MLEGTSKWSAKIAIKGRFRSANAIVVLSVNVVVSCDKCEKTSISFAMQENHIRFYHENILEIYRPF